MKIIDGENAVMEFIIIIKSVLRQIHDLFHSEISIQCDLVFRVSSFSLEYLSFPKDHLISANIFFFVFWSLLGFRLSLLQ
jgi:hypothetical protein